MRPLVAMTVVLIALGGCGGEDESDAAKGVAVEFVNLAGDGQGEKACDLLVSGVRRELDAQARELNKVNDEIEDLGGDVSEDAPLCAEFVASSGGVEFPEAKRVTVDGTKAKVEIVGSGGQTLVVNLNKQGDAWRVGDWSRPGD